jgi:hypothetical protein
MYYYSPVACSNIIMLFCKLNEVDINFDKLCLMTYLASVLYQSEFGDKNIEDYWAFNDNRNHLSNDDMEERWGGCGNSYKINISFDFTPHEKTEIANYSEGDSVKMLKLLHTTFQLIGDKDARDPCISSSGFWKRGKKRNIEGDVKQIKIR